MGATCAKSDAVSTPEPDNNRSLSEIRVERKEQGHVPMAAPETIVAIDFGTTRSAWAYQVSGQADNKILVKIPASADTSASSTKTETVALIGGRGSGDLIAFGPAAIDEYAASDGADDQALFRWFKFDLCESRQDHTEFGSVMTESVGAQHTVPLLGVMTASLRYFKEDVLGFLSRTGGRTVDVNRVWLKEFLGDKFEGIQTTRTLVSIMTSWESKKATFQGLDSAAGLRLNLSELAEYDVTNQDMEILRTSYNDGKPPSLHVGGGKFNVTLPTTLVTSFFTPTLQKIAECLRRIKRESSLHDLYRVFVVGGVSRCPMLREVVRTGLDLPAGRVVEVHEPDLAIVKGTVMYFDRSTIFNSRKARYTYGTDFIVPFNDSIAEHRRRRAAGMCSFHYGKTHLSNAFSVYIRKGDDIPVGGILKRRSYSPVKNSQEAMSFTVYGSSGRNPSFADEKGCFEVGRVSFALDMTKEFEKRGIIGEVTFGGPELIVQILDMEEREITDAVMTMSRAPAPTY